MGTKHQPEHSDFVTITPERAAVLLKLTADLHRTNRAVSQAHINIYAEDMKDGRWKLNGVPVVLDEKGAILDGQHRLQACVRSGVAFRTALVSGVSRDTFDTFDCGRARTSSQVLQMANVKYSTLTSSIIRGVMEFRADGHTDMHMKKVTNAVALLEYRSHSDAYNDAATIGARVVGESHAMTPKMAGTVYYYLTQDLKQDPGTVEKFLTEITSYDSSGNPITDKMRKWNLSVRDQKVSNRTRLGYLILTWNAMINKAKHAPRFSESAIAEMPTFNVK